MTPLQDIKQSDSWAEYLKSMGWGSRKTKNGIVINYRGLPFGFGSVVKIQHPPNFNEEDLPEIEKFCAEKSIQFYFLGYEYTPASWNGGLVEFYKRGDRIGSKAFPKVCTDNLKIRPIYSFLEEYIYTVYNGSVVGRKQAIKEFVDKYGKIDVLIGIAKGEEKRASTNEESPAGWFRDCINKRYPLIDVGLDRQGCQDYIKEVGHVVPLPSACIICPFMNDVELLYLYRFNRYWYDEWVRLEAKKIEAWKDLGDKNLGVWGKKLLPQKLEEIILKHGDKTDEELREYKMSHGHCVMSKY